MTQAEMSKNLESRWAWLTEDIDDAEEKLNTQQVLENAYQYMKNQGLLVNLEPYNSLAESRANMFGHYVEDFDEGQYVEDFEQIIEEPKEEPKKEDSGPTLMAPRLFSVKPMDPPKDSVYYIKPFYANTKTKKRKK